VVIPILLVADVREEVVRMYSSVCRSSHVAIGVFAFRVREPTGKNLGGAHGDKRAVAAYEGIGAAPMGSGRAKVEVRQGISM
jgi:hypothetical protein